MKRISTITLGLLMITLVSVYGQQSKDVETLDPKSFETKLKSLPNATLLDVRTPEEVAEGKIAGAVNIDYNASNFKKKVSALDKDKPYFVYCAKGGRSSKAVEEMQAL